jgi:hypothetical protein
MKNPDKHAICVNCGHYAFLHEMTIGSECAACDSPEIPMDERCPAFMEKKEELDRYKEMAS